MANNVEEKPAVTSARCDSCGAQFKSITWHPGDTCPRCDSDNYGPVLVRKGKSDYETADRSQAFALEDIRFGRLAQWADLIAPKQIQRALHEQKAIAATGKTVPDIATLFVRDQVLTADQVKGILAARRGRPESKDDHEFGTACVRLGYVSQAQLDECRRAQKEADESGLDVLPLPMLIFEKRLMQENQILAILKSSERQGMGLLHRAKTVPGAEPHKSFATVLLGPRDAPLYWVRLGVILIIPLILLFMTYQKATGAGVMTYTQCSKCLAVGAALDNSPWPLMCKECNNKTVYPMGICLDCGKDFPVTGVGYGVKCPKCGSTRFVHHTKTVDVKKIRADIETRKNAGPKE